MSLNARELKQIQEALILRTEGLRHAANIPTKNDWMDVDTHRNACLEKQVACNEMIALDKLVRRIDDELHGQA